MTPYQDLCAFIFRAGGTTFTTRCTNKERKQFLLDHGDWVFGRGQAWKVKFKSLGAGVYEVSAREEKKFTEKP